MSEKSEKVYFLNPFNFVRFVTPPEIPEEKLAKTPELLLLKRCHPPTHDRFLGLTGKIECSLTNLTPLFVTHSEQIENKMKDYKSYEFFKIYDQNGKQTFGIPSTSLRGVLRSVYEMITNSCFSIIEGGLLGKRENPKNYEGILFAGLIKELPRDNKRPGKVEIMDYLPIFHNNFPEYSNKPLKNSTKVYVLIQNGDVIDIKEDETKIKKENRINYIDGYLKTSDRGIGRKGKNRERIFIHQKKKHLNYMNYH